MGEMGPKRAKMQKKIKKVKTSIDLVLKTPFFPTLFLNYKLI